MTFHIYLQSDMQPDATGFINWFDLHKIYSTCPAKYRWEENKRNNVMAIAEHAAILNPNEFERRFIREPAKEDYPDALINDKDLISWLKDRGISGYSGKKHDELIELIDLTGEKPLIWKKLIDDFYNSIGNKSSVPSVIFDKVLQMRAVIFGNEKFATKFSDSFNDATIIGDIDDVNIRVRYDVITTDGSIIDYVGCMNADSKEFTNQAIRGGYYLKQALLHDIFTEAYGHAPTEQLILAQERNFPHIPEYYRITNQFLEIGRLQYKSALFLYKQCIENDVWPTYSIGDEVTDIIVPEYYAKQYGVNEK